MESQPNKIRTVALVCTALNVLGGLSRHILQLYLHLNRKKFRVIIVYFSKNKTAVEPFFIQGGVRREDLFFVPLSGADLFLSGILGLARVFRSENVDVVHTFLLHSDILGFAAGQYAGVKRFISSVEGKLLPDEVNGVGKVKQFVYGFFNRELRKSFDLTVTVSEELKAEVLRTAPRIKDISVIPVGVSSTVPYEQLQRRSHPSYFVIGCLSQLSKDKGVEHLIRAVPYVRSKFPQARFLIAGAGEEEQNLKKLAMHLNVEEHVSFLGWVKDAQTFLLGTDIFVMPSLREGCPAALLEALSLARPAVGFDVPGIKEIIRHGENGILVEPFDVEQMAKEIVALCRDLDYAQRLGRRGKELVEKKYSIQAEMEKIENEYSRLCFHG